MKLHIHAKRAAIERPDINNHPIPACDAPEQSTGSRRLALSSILNDPEPMEEKSNIKDGNFSNTQPETSSIDCDTTSDSSSVEILSDSHSLITTSHDNLTLIGLNIESLPQSPQRSDFSLATGSEDVLKLSDDDDIAESQSCVMLPSPVVGSMLHLQGGNEDVEIGSTCQVLPVAHVPSKHQRSISDDLAVPIASTSSKRRALNDAYEHQSGPTGISRSAQADRAANEAYRNGTLVVLPHERAAFLRRALAIDPSAQLDPEDLGCKKVWHGPCKKWITMAAPKRTGKYRAHLSECKGKNGLRKNGKFTKAATGSLRIDVMFNTLGSSNPSTRDVTPTSRSAPSSPVLSPTPPPLVPCLGIRPEHDVRLHHLIGRDPLGGRKSVRVLSKERYNSEYRDLPKEKKTQIQMIANATAKWQVYYEPQAHVRSTSCLRECDPSVTEIGSLAKAFTLNQLGFPCVVGLDIGDGPKDLCQKCADVLWIREFWNALGREPAPKENLKFVPHSHRNKQQALLHGRYVGLETIIEQADSKRSPIMALVTKTLTGELKNADTFLGLMQVMAEKEDRVSRGKGMQQFSRPPAFVSFCHALLVSSPRGYNLLGKHFPLPAERNLRLHRSHAPGFPIGVTSESINRVVKYLEGLEYTGPICIGCDDTQLLSKFSPYFDGPTNK
ncbi:hypothetical protein FRC08_010299 [Ceratobasidium sp. 394]|nr:hypothetical protein FRC08_010299 [Ceratobasidium sp. 394]